MMKKNEIYVKVPKDKISFLTKIIEGYDNMGVVSTVNPEEGWTVIRITPDTETEARQVLAHLPFVEMRKGTDG